jgi:hypothetical protein
MKLRALVEQLPHGDATQHTLISRLLTSTFAKLRRRTALATKYSPWEKYPCVLTGNPQRVDGVVLFQVTELMWFWRKYVNVLISGHTKD